MMKCPVCQKKIPLGEERCPHCGIKLTKESSSYHIKHQKIKKILFIVIAIVIHIKHQKIKKILFIVIAIVITLMGASDILRYEKKEQIRKSHEISELSFTQLMDREVYKNNKDILILAQESLEDMTQFLKDNHFTNENDISYTKRIGYSIVAVARLEFEKDNILYDIHRSFASDDTFDESIGFSIEFNNLKGIEKETFLPKDVIDLIAHILYDIHRSFASDDTFDESIGFSIEFNNLKGIEKETFLPKDVIDLIAQYLKIDGAYNDLNEAKKRMNKDQNEYINHTIKNKEITVNKSFDEELKHTSITFSICQDYKE